MGTVITPARKDLVVEELDFKSGISEATWINRIGASINFINQRQFQVHVFKFNGTYALGVGSFRPDGPFTYQFDYEIAGLYYFNGDAGTSGADTVFDIHEVDPDGTDQGSIFTVKPTINSTAPANSVTNLDVVNSLTVSNPTGHNVATFAKTQFNAGQQLIAQIDSAMPGALDSYLGVFYRAR